jgi:hypothetical protein
MSTSALHARSVRGNQRANAWFAYILELPTASEFAPMTKFIIAAILVLALLVSGLMGLLRGKDAPMGSPEVLERAKKRERELEEQEKRENNR